MARPLKTGLEYFPIDVDIDQDDKMYMIEAELGEVSFGRIIKLFAEIYRGDGYFKKWEEEDVLIFCGKKRVDVLEIKQLVKTAINRRIFDKVMFEKYHILTSAGIQKRYIAACEKRAKIQIFQEIALFNDSDFPSFLSNKIELVSFRGENGGYSGENPSFRGDNQGFRPEKPPERKGEESKVKGEENNEFTGRKPLNPETELSNILAPFSPKKINLSSSVRKLINNFCTDYGSEEFLKMVRENYVPAKAKTGKIRFINEDLPDFIQRHRNELKGKPPKYKPDPDMEDIRKNGTGIPPEESEQLFTNIFDSLKSRRLYCPECNEQLEVYKDDEYLCRNCNQTYVFDEVFKRLEKKAKQKKKL